MDATSTLAQRFSAAIDRIKATVIRHVARTTRVLDPILLLTLARFSRWTTRLETLETLWKAGKLPKPGPRKPTKKPTPTAPRPRTPTSRAWLIKHIQPACTANEILYRWAQDPELRALHDAAPQVGRILRPMAQALGLTIPDAFLLPKKPRAKPAPKPKPERPTPHRSSDPEHLRMKIPGVDIPLPRAWRDPPMRRKRLLC